MNHLKNLFAISLAFFLFACGPKTEPKEEQEEVAPVEVKEEPLEENHDLVLNNGEIWEANAETTEGVEKMQAQLDAFSEKESIDAYKELKDSLIVSFTMIFQKCTMKGEAHNQLHNFLIPIKNELDAMNSNDLEVCRSSFENLNKHIKKYDEFFKTAS